MKRLSNFPAGVRSQLPALLLLPVVHGSCSVGLSGQPAAPVWSYSRSALADLSSSPAAAEAALEEPQSQPLPIAPVPPFHRRSLTSWLAWLFSRYRLPSPGLPLPLKSPSAWTSAGSPPACWLEPADWRSLVQQAYGILLRTCSLCPLAGAIFLSLCSSWSVLMKSKNSSRQNHRLITRLPCSSCEHKLNLELLVVLVCEIDEVVSCKVGEETWSSQEEGCCVPD
eukprot:764147-Hanusia_phi.AAC.1